MIVGCDEPASLLKAEGQRQKAVRRSERSMPKSCMVRLLRPRAFGGRFLYKSWSFASRGVSSPNCPGV